MTDHCNRRTFLAATSAAGVGSIVPLSDHVSGATTNPRILDFWPRYTADSGTVWMTITVASDATLETLYVEHTGDSTKNFEKSLTGNEATKSNGFDVPATGVGEMNTVRIEVTDANGTSFWERDVYARNHDVLENTNVDVSAVYTAWIGENWDCGIESASETEPAIGYWNTDGRKSMNRHVDQMQGHGITPQIPHKGFGGPREDFLDWQEKQLAPETTYETFLDFPKFWKRRGHADFEEHLGERLESCAEDFIENDRVSHKRNANGRPFVTLWDAGWYPWKTYADEIDPETYIEDRWGGWAEFVDFIRSKLTVDGTEPYLIADTPSTVGVGTHTYYLKQFDGVTGWTQKCHEEDSWSSLLTKVENDFEKTHSFADDNGMGFVPCVFPGFDDRHNTCWGSDRYFERSVTGFADLLRLAEEYKTDPPNKIQIASWCDWGEGHQIEPGRLDGKDYGTSYVDEVAKYQQDPTNY